MSGADETSGKKLVPHAGYEVGYGKPPMETRFKKGQSGNPRGRPKGAKNKRPGLHEERLKDIILDEAYRGIAVREGERMVTIPMAQAIIRSMAVNAAKAPCYGSGACELCRSSPPSTPPSRTTSIRNAASPADTISRPIVPPLSPSGAVFSRHKGQLHCPSRDWVELVWQHRHRNS